MNVSVHVIAFYLLGNILSLKFKSINTVSFGYEQKQKEGMDRQKKELIFREMWERGMESPPIIPAGNYDLKRDRFREKLQKDYQAFLALVHIFISSLA